MSVLGLTIDYGPYSFVDDFDLNFTPNTTDLPGRRYALVNSPRCQVEPRLPGWGNRPLVAGYGKTG
jgi:hypothetical protein